jgi:phospholipase C
LRDIKHVVLLMQENRSFDHYFGTMAGVRGFDDPTALKLSTGNRWNATNAQPHAARLNPASRMYKLITLAFVLPGSSFARLLRKGCIGVPRVA